MLGGRVIEIWIGDDEGCTGGFGAGGAEEISSGGEISDDIVRKKDIKGEVAEIAIGGNDEMMVVEIGK
jgi:hypothetical protein